MRKFDLNLLSALEVLLEERNVTRAADRLNVTQPTMSGMLQRLRFQFDDQILIRVGRQMELTPLGDTLIEKVRDALRGVDALVQTELVFDPRTSTRRFTMMASDYCAAIFVPQIISALSLEAPKLHLDVVPLNAPIEQLSSGAVDLCISTDDFSLLTRDRDSLQIESEFLFADEFKCIAALEHPLGKQPELSEYLAYPHVGVHLPGNLDTIEASSLRRHAPDYSPTHTVGDFSLVPGLVASSDRLLGMVQTRLLALTHYRHRLRVFDPPFRVPPINETMMWHSRTAGDPQHQWFRQMLSRIAREWLLEDKRHAQRPISGFAVTPLVQTAA